jgi:hypothetical protein
MLPFSRDDFFLIFTTYNNDIWPIQLVALVLGAAVMTLALSPLRRFSRVAWLATAAMWLWTGIAYHMLYFATINPIAYAFGALFVVHGFLLLRSGVFNDALPFADKCGYPQGIGIGLMIFAAIVYPALGLMLGHAFPGAPSFGVTPCPLTIFTLGVMMMTREPARTVLLLVPVTWSVIGSTAAIFLGVYEDLALIVSAVVVVTITWHLRRQAFAARSLGRV